MKVPEIEGPWNLLDWQNGTSWDHGPNSYSHLTICTVIKETISGVELGWASFKAKLKVDRFSYREWTVNWKSGKIAQRDCQKVHQHQVVHMADIINGHAVNLILKWRRGKISHRNVKIT